MTRSDPSEVTPDKAPGVRVGYDRIPNERFKNGDVDGWVRLVHVGIYFEVLDSKGKNHAFPWGTENDYDRCPGCGKVDPASHRWYFVRSLTEAAAHVEAAVTHALAELHDQMAAHMRAFKVVGEVRVNSEPDIKGGYAMLIGVVIPRVLCEKAPVPEEEWAR